MDVCLMIEYSVPQLDRWRDSNKDGGTDGKGTQVTLYAADVEPKWKLHWMHLQLNCDCIVLPLCVRLCVHVCVTTNNTTIISNIDYRQYKHMQIVVIVIIYPLWLSYGELTLKEKNASIKKLWKVGSCVKVLFKAGKFLQLSWKGNFKLSRNCLFLCSNFRGKWKRSMCQWNVSEESKLGIKGEIRQNILRKFQKANFIQKTELKKL